MGNNLRWFAAIITAAWLLTGGSRVHAAPARSAAAPPNIVLIISDDQSWTDYGFMGHPDIRTPCLDRLAAESAVFPRGYVPTALCRPSLMSIVTGLYPHQHRTTGNDPAKTPANARRAREASEDVRELLICHVDRRPTLPRLLSQKGYWSFQCGKWWEGNFRRGGFTEGMTLGFPHPGGRHGDAGLKIGRETMEPLFDFIDRAAAAGRPFFVWYAPFLPHEPHNPPERILRRCRVSGRPESIAKYYAMCEWFDETCGRLLKRLEEKGLRENTLIVYLADNGWIQKPAGRGFAPRSKQSPYEGGVRTPILFSWPGVIRPGVRERELCSSVDIAPTILGAAGLCVPINLPGRNLMPALRQGRPAGAEAVFGETFAHDIADIEDPEASLLYRWVVRGRWKLLLTYDGAAGRVRYPPKDMRPQLFDLLADPREERNLAGKEPERVRELAGELEAWWPVRKRHCVTAWRPKSVPWPQGK